MSFQSACSGLNNFKVKWFPEKKRVAERKRSKRGEMKRCFLDMQKNNNMNIHQSKNNTHTQNNEMFVRSFVRLFEQKKRANMATVFFPSRYTSLWVDEQILLPIHFSFKSKSTQINNKTNGIEMRTDNRDEVRL